MPRDRERTSTKGSRRRSASSKRRRGGCAEESGRDGQKIRTDGFEATVVLTQMAQRVRRGLEVFHERVKNVPVKWQKRVLVALATIVTLIIFMAAVTSDKNSMERSAESQYLDMPSLRSTPRRKRRRKHLHEICPHIVKTLGAPYQHSYSLTLGEMPSSSTSSTKSTSKIPQLTTVYKGDIPVVLGVPHGASHKDSKYAWQVEHLESREGASVALNSSDFQSRLSRVNSDTNTQAMAKKIAEIFAKKYKHKPYIVQADFHRRYVDANRRVNHSEACCQEMWPKCTAVAEYRLASDGSFDQVVARKVNRARTIYDEYHGAIISVLNEIHQSYPGKPIYFIDIHAQRAATDEELDITAADMEETIIVGTQDGRLVKSREALYAPTGLLGRLQGAGVKIYPPNNAVPDHRLYNGGHGVAEYCYNNTLGGEVNGLQMEFGFRLRMRYKTLERTASALVKVLNDIAVP